MAMHPIQFQAGMSLSELFEQYGTQAQCEQALQQARWPKGFQCPHCGATEHSHFYVEGTRYWQMRGLSNTDESACRDDLPWLEAGVACLVSGDLPDEPVEKQHRGA
jgi:hypothetical protein